MYIAREESQLIEDCQKRIAAAQRQLYEQYSRKMMGVCMRYVNNYETARDLMHDGFIKIFLNISSFAHEGSFEGWMRRIFVTTSLEFLRKNDVLRESYDLATSYEVQENDETIIERISTDELREIIAGLPAGFRSVFNLYAIEGYSHKEIGEMLGIAESTSRSQFARARALLQQKMVEIYGYSQV
ncbi:RNA polymerase sigma factor [Paludibacter jiangxiensis]|uniref:RNA polymerase sigma-70 factor, ECF subfamily n=1 Tax=Paludibacter jiangxiensis TaxID=681398 RepID=A0A170YCF6_9BACT|nr:sigma-70 family RNA polymerase sigma factor [Paludibacter jiangxiensis]GAT61694.1 RNA polymerase sigma-70 factor, ECF subfamily [Paludibacter jiangxiensis]